MDVNKVVAQIATDISNGLIKTEVTAMGRFYVSTSDPNKRVLLSDKQHTAEAYYNTFIAPPTTSSASGFDTFNRCTIFVGNPDTGKTYRALQICKDLSVDYILKIGNEDTSLETLLEDFTLVDGKPCYQESMTLKMLSDPQQKPCFIIIDEFNSIRTGVMKTLQPLLDTTSTDFEFRGKVYTKNPNCKFIFTLNDNDKGISVLPNAILSRSEVIYFDIPDDNMLAQWTGYNVKFIKEARELYRFFECEDIFGTRQLKILYRQNTPDLIKAHIKGLIKIRQLDNSTIDTPETIARVNGLLGAR